MSRFARIVMLGAVGLTLAACRSELVAGLTARDRDGGQDAATVDPPDASPGGDGGAVGEGGAPGEGGAVAAGGALPAGGAGAVLEIEPPLLDFKEVPIGGGSNLGVLTVKNTGGARSGGLSISPLDRSFLLQVNGCVRSLAPQESCSMRIMFAAMAEGLARTPVTVSDGRAQATANLIGTGVRPRILQLTPEAHDFGAVPVGSAGAAAMFELRNTREVEASHVTVTSTGEFIVVEGQCDRPLLPQQSCLISVVFAPGTAGAKTGVMTVGLDSALAASSVLSGTAVVVQGLVVSPAHVDFGRVPLGAASAPQTMTITNTAATEQPVFLSVTGDGPGGFTPMSGCSARLGAGKSCDLSVVFRPVRVGTHRGTMIVGSPGFNEPAELLGDGLAP